MSWCYLKLLFRYVAVLRFDQVDGGGYYGDVNGITNSLNYPEKSIDISLAVCLRNAKITHD